jgi:hypothetical protein
MLNKDGGSRSKLLRYKGLMKISLGVGFYCGLLISVHPTGSITKYGIIFSASNTVPISNVGMKIILWCSMERAMESRCSAN